MNRDPSTSFIRIPNLKMLWVGFVVCLPVFMLSHESYGDLGSSLRLETLTQIRTAFGNPIGTLTLGNRSILQYETHEFWLEGDEVVDMRRHSMDHHQNEGELLPEIIIHDSQQVKAPESLGLLPSDDTYIRGGRFDHLFHNQLNRNHLAISGIHRYVSQNTGDQEISHLQSSIRKGYLQFDTEYMHHGTSSLILHTSRPWFFPGAGIGVSPTVHVFAILPEPSDEGPWDEQRLSWSNAKGNSVLNGADLRKAVRLCSKHFELLPGDIGRLPEHFELRFELGSLEPYFDANGSVTLLVTHSSESRLDLVSKEGEADPWLCPRLVLE